MPAFKFTSPEGKSYTINGPEGATQEQAFSILQQQLGTAPTEHKDNPSMLTSGVAGLGKGFGDVVLGAQGLLGKGVQKLGETITPDKESLTSLVTGKKNRGLIQSAGDWLVNDAQSGRAKLAGEVAPYKEANPISTSVGEIGGNVIATFPVGGALAGGIKATAPTLVRAGASAPLLQKLSNAVGSAGFTTGAPAATTLAGRAANLGIRSAGGAVTGGTSAALINQDDAGTGAVIGAALPPALGTAGKILPQLAKGAYAMAQPFTKAGQENLAGKIINRFAEGGPTNLDIATNVAGSSPTLAEATGNAGIARLQSATRDISPNPFMEREIANAFARNAAFDKIAGDSNLMSSAIAERQNAAQALYDKAFTADAMRQDLATSAQKMRAPFVGAGLSAEKEVLSTPGLRELATRPMFKQAVDDAKKLAANNGVKLDDPLQSLQGLHYIKLALDDALNPAAKTAMGRNSSAAVMDMRDKLAGELAEVSPLYGNARSTYAEMSKPINAMEALQGLKITDTTGKITLSKVQNAISGLEAKRAKPGIDSAKAITDEQLGALYSIRDDLLRAAKTGMGRSAGSNTFQNIATDNIMSSFLPGRSGEIVGDKFGGAVGQLGKLMYSGPNEAIRNRIVELMLDPVAAKNAMESAKTPLLQRIAGSRASAVSNSAESALPVIYRTAPVISADRNRK